MDIETKNNTFDIMLDSLYLNLNTKKSKFEILLPEPLLVKSGHKTIWKNTKDFLKLINRDPDNFILFINTNAMSGTYWLTDSVSNGCIFQNKTTKEHIYEIMKKYIMNQVLCKSCQSLDTIIEKNKDIRKYNFFCNNCKNEYYV